MAIKVLIADDHRVVAEGLRSLLQEEEDITVIGCVENGRDAVRKAIEENPDVVLMDNAMPELNGTEATLLIRERRPAIRVVILSMESNPEYVVRALQAGAAGYVPKKSAVRDVVRAIREVHAGRRYLDKDLTQQVMARLVDLNGQKDTLSTLSSRERQVLQLLAEGRTTVEIASALALSPKTVETYRARLMEKTGLHDIASLVRFAIQNRIVSLN
jgi:two-component system, NarL family, response regulator NreC